MPIKKGPLALINYEIEAMKKIYYPTIFAILISGITFLYFNASSDECTYKITGYVKVKSQFPEFKNDTFSLAKLPVKVSGKSCLACTYSSWGETETDTNGYYEVTKEKNGNACNGRYIKVKVKFENDDLRIRDGGLLESLGDLGDWYTIGKRDNDECDGFSTCTFGDQVFKEGANYERDEEISRKHADLWWIYSWALDYLPSIIPTSAGYFTTLDIIYPLNRLLIPDGAGESSYVSPFDKTLHLFKENICTDEDCDHFFDVEGAIFHELGHVWAFHNTTGESVMASYLLSHLSAGTHGIVGKTEVAFHEGFAQFFGTALFRNLLIDFEKLETKIHYDLPYSKYYLKNTIGLGDHKISCKKNKQGSVDCHDDAWTSILSSLEMGSRTDPFLDDPDIIYWDFIADNKVITNLLTSDSVSCHTDRPAFSLKNLLNRISGDSGNPNQMDTSEMNLDGLLERLEYDNNIDPLALDYFKELWNVSTETNPIDLYCDKAFLINDIISDDNEESINNYQWNYDTSTNRFNKVLTIRTRLINSSNVELPLTSYLINPQSYIKSSSSNDTAYTPIISYDGTTLDPGETNYESYELSVEAAINGQFPVTTITWSTLVTTTPTKLFSKEISDVKSKNDKDETKNIDEDWVTNSKSITFGPDYKANIFAIRDGSFKGNLNQEVLNNLMSSGSGESSLGNGLEEDEKTKSKDSNADSSNDLELDLEVTHGQEYYTVVCGAINVGNVSPYIKSKLALYRNGALLEEVEIDPISPGNSHYHRFTVSYSSQLDGLDNIEGKKQGLEVKCVVDHQEEIEELSEDNNEVSETIIYPDNNIPIFGKIDPDGFVDKSINTIIDGIIERSKVHDIIEENYQHQDFHKMIDKLKNLKDLVREKVIFNYYEFVINPNINMEKEVWLKNTQEFYQKDTFIEPVENLLQENMTRTDFKNTFQNLNTQHWNNYRSP